MLDGSKEDSGGYRGVDSEGKNRDAHLQYSPIHSRAVLQGEESVEGRVRGLLPGDVPSPAQ